MGRGGDGFGFEGAAPDQIPGGGPVQVHPIGPPQRASRPESGPEIVTSSDQWLRPEKADGRQVDRWNAQQSTVEKGTAPAWAQS